MSWKRDKRLTRDSVFIAEHNEFEIRLFDDARYFWILIIPQLDDIIEWHDLNPDQSARMMMIANHLGLAMKQHSDATKINIAAIGNMVRQFHLHVVARKEADPAWPGPVWGHSPAVTMPDALIDARRGVLLDSLKGI